ncbi:MAG: protease modulator HflC [Phycisphaerae bacterium]|nr:protease modulator HflC [Phycisphaerae bacterium]
MRNKAVFVLAVLLVAALIFYSVTFQVRFNEVAVVTTFDKADGAAIIRGNEDGAGALGNLHFKWPWPIQKVRSYDHRVSRLDDLLEEQLTRDQMSVVVNAYVMWQVDNPLDFYRSTQEDGRKAVARAESRIRSWLRDTRSEISKYDLKDLTNSDPAQLKLAQVEQNMLKSMRDKLKANEQEKPLGIRFVSVGIKRLILSDTASTSVQTAMASNRNSLAQRARSEGEAQAERIRARANETKAKILAVAGRRAQAIRAEGDAAAVKQYDTFKKDETFAIFLRELETYKKTFSSSPTLIIDAKEGFGKYLLEPPNLQPSSGSSK